MTIRSKITVSLVSVAVLLGTTVLVATSLLLPRYLKQQLHARGVQLASAIGGENRNAILGENWFDLKASLARAASRQPDVAYLFVMDGMGRVLAHTFDEGFPTELRNANRPIKPARRQIRVMDTGSTRIYDVAECVWIDEEQIGTVRVGLNMGGVQRIIRQTFGSIVLATLGVMVVGISVGAGLSGLIVKPIRVLRKGTEIVGGGDFEHRVGTDAKDEIGQLSRAFDAMTEKLKTVTASRDELNREVEQRERAERAQQETLANLERSNRDLEQFAYSASHDLQEPLRKVTAFGDLLRRDCGEAVGEDGHKYIEVMMSATERMQNLINALLTFSRVVTRGKQFAPVNLNEVVSGVLSDLETRISETGAVVDVGELPVIDADPTQMRQLTQNLIGNALKFHKKDEAPHVNVFAEPVTADDGDRPVDSATQWRLVVADNGIGFDEQYAERIFGVFQRLHARQKYSGSGIGLAVCRRIAERHGGTIEAKPKPDGGAMFVVMLPAKHEENEQEDPA